jgi:hypothetical protein
VRSYDPSYDLTIYAFSIPQRSLVGSRFWQPWWLWIWHYNGLFCAPLLSVLPFERISMLFSEKTSSSRKQVLKPIGWKIDMNHFCFRFWKQNCFKSCSQTIKNWDRIVESSIQFSLILKLSVTIQLQAAIYRGLALTFIAGLHLSVTDSCQHNTSCHN